ncbi:hypothetical protein CDD83_8136 [Cordyceps sp. RAO-2017]|nr:hypothetical protein CDD83_8136 [Cordyceps sp. RAO-2017]
MAARRRRTCACLAAPPAPLAEATASSSANGQTTATGQWHGGGAAAHGAGVYEQGETHGAANTNGSGRATRPSQPPPELGGDKGSIGLLWAFRGRGRTAFEPTDGHPAWKAGARYTPGRAGGRPDAPLLVLPSRVSLTSPASTDGCACGPLLWQGMLLRGKR